MPFNGAGLFVPVAFPDYPAISGTLILASSFNTNMADLFNGLSNCITRDGQSPPSANLPMAGARHTDVGAAVTDTDYAQYGQIKSFVTAAVAGAATASSSSVQTLSNKSIDLAANTVTGTKAQFNTACSDADFATTAGAETLTNKAISGSTNTLTDIPQSALAANIAGNGPAFSAYALGSQGYSATSLTVVTLDTEVFDSAGCYSTSTYAFTPNVAGYYYISGTVSAVDAGTSYASIEKNGVEYCRGAQADTLTGKSVNGLVYLNGTTDYVKLLAWHQHASTGNGGTTPLLTHFQGFLARAA